MKRIVAIALTITISLVSLTACSEAAYVTHEAEILDKRVAYEQSSQWKLGDYITSASTREVYRFDLRREDGKIVTEEVDRQDYYDHEIGDTYTYTSLD